MQKSPRLNQNVSSYELIFTAVTVHYRIMFHRDLVVPRSVGDRNLLGMNNDDETYPEEFEIQMDHRIEFY